MKRIERFSLSSTRLDADGQIFAILKPETDEGVRAASPRNELLDSEPNRLHAAEINLAIVVDDFVASVSVLLGVAKVSQLDNITFESLTAVPEPGATLVLAFLGGVYAWRRQRNSRASSDSP